MSHVASYVAVVIFISSIVFEIVALNTDWWGWKQSYSLTVEGVLHTTVDYKVNINLWEVSSSTKATNLLSGVPKIGIPKFPLLTDKPAIWDEECDKPKLGDHISAWCGKIPAMRAMIILGLIFSAGAAIGVAAGIYTGNTLIDAFSGAVGAFANVCTALAIVLCVTCSFEELITKKVDSGLGGMGFAKKSGGGLESPTVGYLMALITCGLQLVGGFFSCVGTCQEMHDVARLASSLPLTQSEKEALEPKTRAEKAAKCREAENEQAREMYRNIQRRMNQADAMSFQKPKQEDETSADAEEGEKQKRPPVMLQRVLFRKPLDGDDDEIPQQMLVDAFAEIDDDGSGSIDVEELVDSLRLCGLNVSKNATDTIMKEIDKNASGDVDLREFIEFFRHIEDLNRFQKKSAARQQFFTILVNCLFLSDILVVGVLLMMFIRMDENKNPDNYSIMKNVLLACSVVLGVLFLMVILIPILRLALGPTASKMQKQYEMAQVIKKAQAKSVEDTSGCGGLRQTSYAGDDPPPPVNAAMFGRSYRPGKVDQQAWSPSVEDEFPPAQPQRSSTHSTTMERQESPARVQTASSGGHSHRGGGGKGNVRKGNWRYDPSNYDVARDFAEMQAQRNMGPMTWSAMQVRESGIATNTNPAVLPGVSLAITDAAMPYGNK